MNYTSNYHLPQWASSDRVRMEDFNNAMANIESGLTSNAQAAASAQSAAEEAKASAAGSAQPYVTGTYTGTGLMVQRLTLGFRPSFLIISGMQQTEEQYAVSLSAMTAGSNGLGSRVMLLSSGFVVYGEPYEGVSYPALNRQGVTYDYIAFK